MVYRVYKQSLWALGLIMGLIFTSSAIAAITTYSDAAAFDAQFPNLKFEDFEEGVVGNNTIVACPSPLDPTTNNACFSPGDITANISFRHEGNGSGLALSGPGWGGALSKHIVANIFVDSFVIDFSTQAFFESVTAVGFDLISIYSNSTCDITVNLAGGASTQFSSPCTDTGTFFGVYSTIEIVSIEIDSQTDQAEGVDNVRFGHLCPPTPAMGCTSLGNATLKVAGGSKSLLAYKAKGPVPDMGNPAVDASHQTCIYNSNNEIAVLLPVAAGGADVKGKPLWKQKGSKNLYKNSQGNEAGVGKVIQQAGAGLKLLAKGDNLDIGNLTAPLIVQQHASNGSCTTSTFVTLQSKKSGGIKAKTP